MSKELIFKELPKYGDLISIKQWLEMVRDGSLIDYDGFGNYAKETMCSNIEVIPSDITKRKQSPPVWATHVVWYNR